MQGDDILGTTGHVEALEYTTQQLRPDMGATINIPYSTINGADIIAENLENKKIQ